MSVSDVPGQWAVFISEPSEPIVCPLHFTQETTSLIIGFLLTTVCHQWPAPVTWALSGARSPAIHYMQIRAVNKPSHSFHSAQRRPNAKSITNRQYSEKRETSRRFVYSSYANVLPPRNDWTTLGWRVRPKVADQIKYVLLCFVHNLSWHWLIAVAIVVAIVVGIVAADAGRVTFSNSNNYHQEARARMSRASCSNLIISDYYCNVCVKTTNVTAACSSAATGW